MGDSVTVEGAVQILQKVTHSTVGQGELSSRAQEIRDRTVSNVSASKEEPLMPMLASMLSNCIQTEKFRQTRLKGFKTFTSIYQVVSLSRGTLIV